MTTNHEQLSAPLIGILRHRMATDGQGVTTLVAFHGCTLRCRYCLNPQCLNTEMVWRNITPRELLDQVMIDNLYFLATGGGVTFGGGEPLLRSEFIEAFAQLRPKQWHLIAETSLNVPRHHLERVVPHIDGYIVDIKDTDPDIYHAYTTRDGAQALNNLQWLMQQDSDIAKRVTVRLPLIPGYNTHDHVARSRQRLADIGVTQFDEFSYIIPNDKY